MRGCLSRWCYTAKPPSVTLPGAQAGTWPRTLPGKRCFHHHATHSLHRCLRFHDLRARDDFPSSARHVCCSSRKLPSQLAPGRCRCGLSVTSQTPSPLCGDALVARLPRCPCCCAPIIKYDVQISDAAKLPSSAEELHKTAAGRHQGTSCVPIFLHFDSNNETMCVRIAVGGERAAVRLGCEKRQRGMFDQQD